MRISRNFLLIGALYLVVGILFGMYMGGSGDHSLTPVHAHINLLGFTLMTLFGLAYHILPALAGSGLARAHFWLHQGGVLVLMLLLFLLITGRVAESVAGPILMIAEIAVLVGVGAFALNLYRNVR